MAAVSTEKAVTRTAVAKDTAAAEDVAQRLECKICMASQVQAVLVPCGHLCACWACAAQLASCPVCRTAVQQRVRTFV